MDMRPLLRIVALLLLTMAVALGIRALRGRSSRRWSGIAAGALAALALAGFVLSSLNLLAPHAPVPASLTLYYVRNGVLEAAAADTGAVRWRYAPPGTDLQWPPALDDGVLYLGTGTGFSGSSSSIRALRARDGKELWVVPVQGRADQETPAVENGVVYATSAGGIYAWRASDGSQLWHVSWSVNNLSSAHVAAGIVYVAASAVSTAGPPSQATTVYALRARDGVTLWKHTLGDEGFDSLTVADGTIYARSLRSGLVALDASDGTLRWQRQDLGEGSSPAVANGVVYLTAIFINSTPDVAVLALDARDGSERWRTLLDYSSQDVTAAGNTLYVGGSSVYALRVSDGHVRWSYGAHELFFQPVVAHGVVFIGSSDEPYSFHLFGLGSTNDLNALDASSGRLYWHTSGTVEGASVFSS